ncbi:PREDICTED: uncharacterized protein LOC109480065 [Branchiostoma belcheri]|uniref:Uncharacterized protein LOC109480065 n=1 Tax=Branchiostoma belcheri TaxID=7741 RepID=A0A6P4ZLV6_BRABE|nr:PREDICTED: uncharacterized protein LOC109480065 [Branchiostoma belcheri]
MRETAKEMPEKKGRGKIKMDNLEIPPAETSPNLDPGVLTPGDVCLPGFVTQNGTDHTAETTSGPKTQSRRPTELNVSDSSLKSSRARVPKAYENTSAKQATTAVVHIPETRKLQYLMPPEPHPPIVKPQRANDSGVESCESEPGTKLGSTQEPQKPIVFTFEVPYALVQQRYDQPHLVVFDSDENNKDDAQTQKTSGTESKESVVTVGSRGAGTRSKERRYCDGCTLTIVLIVIIVVGNIIGAVYVYHKYNMINSSLPATISPVLTTIHTTQEAGRHHDDPPTTSSTVRDADDTIWVRFTSAVTSADFR